MNKRKSILPIMAVILIVGLLIGGYLVFNKNGPLPYLPFTVTGMQILSLSPVTIQSNSPSLAGQSFQVLALAGAGNDYLSGTQTAGRRYAPTDLNSILSSITSGEKVSKGFNIAVDSFDMDCRYQINAYSGYDAYIIYKAGLGLGQTCTVSSLNVRGLTCLGLIPLVTLNSNCIYKCLDGTYGKLSTSYDQIWTIVTTLSPDGGTPTSVTLSNAGSTSGTFGNAGTVKLMDGAITGFACSTTNDKVGAFISKANNQPVLIQNGIYTATNAINVVVNGASKSYSISQVNNAFTECVGNAFLGVYDDAKVTNCMNSINQQVIQKSDATMQDPAWARAQIDLAAAGTSGSSLGYARIKPNSPTSHSFLSYSIYADSLAIVRNVGKPQITLAAFDKSTIYRNEIASLTVLVKNVGGASSDTEVKVECSGPASYTQTQNAALAVNQEKSFVFNVQGASTTCASSTCTISAKDRNDMGGSVSTASKSLTVCNFNQCPAVSINSNADGTKQCANGDRIQICDSSGSWSDSVVCKATEFCDVATLTCKTRVTDTTIPIIPTTTIPPNECMDRDNPCWCQKYPTDPVCSVLCISPAGLGQFNLGKWIGYYGCQINHWFFVNQLPFFLSIVITALFVWKVALKIFGVTAVSNPIFYLISILAFILSAVFFIWIFSLSQIIGWVLGIAVMLLLMVVV